jgi:hypothetical protein
MYGRHIAGALAVRLSDGRARRTAAIALARMLPRRLHIHGNLMYSGMDLLRPE